MPTEGDLVHSATGRWENARGPGCLPTAPATRVNGTRAVLPADAFVVHIPPEIDVVLGVRDLDHLDGRGVPARQFQLFDVDVEPLDAVEDAFGVIDEATRGGGVAALRRQRCHALQERAAQLV